MANDSTNAGTASVQDTTPTEDTYFTDMQGEADAFFGPEQLAQANTQTKVPAPQGENVIRVQVNPGEIIELSSPFDPGVTLLAREGDGNLAIRVGDVTVILQGYVDANQAAPVVVETSDGQPIDIAILLASTDPAIDIQTAAGPGDAGQGGQGADNSGAFFGQLGLGAGLGGFNGVGAQDGTSLSYGLIDNSIRLDREDALLLAGSTRFPGLSEPFLRDPFTNAPFADFTSFLTAYGTYVGTTNPGGGWGDFEGTSATGTDFESYLEQTSFTNQVSHSSTNPEPMSLDLIQLAAIVSSMSSNGQPLYVDTNSTGETAFIRREGDDALILVIHAHAPGDLDDTTPANGTGGFQIDAFLINRLDHPDQGQDVLDLTIPYRIDHPPVPQEQSEQVEGPYYEEVPPTLGSVDVLIQDDIPIASPTEFANFLHSADFKDALGCLFAVVNGQITDYTVTIGKGHVDEDYIFGGNRDKDNADGPDSDPVRGDDIGSKFLVGGLVIEWGADGPSGKVPPPTQVTLGDILSGPKCPALTVGLSKGDTFPGDVTSDGHTLKVLEKSTIIGGIEVLKVGYCDDGGHSGDAKSSGFGGDDVVVFTLYLQANPNAPLFGAFVFELCGPIDHDPETSTIESNLALVIPIIATDDDGDHPLEDVNITVLVNDDAPMIKDVEYISQKGGIPCEDEGTPGFTGGGGNDTTITSNEYGIVDEDWLKGDGKKDVLTITGVTPNEGGNHDKDGNGDNNAGQDGDDYGKTKVKGEIDVSFGGDGPAACDPFAFKGAADYDTSDPQNLPVFKDADGTTYTSGDHVMVVLRSSEGYLEVGYIPEGSYIPPEGSGLTEYTPEPVVIFTMEIDDSGCFEFHLCGPIDHTGADEQTLDIKFDVTVTDNDGDQAEVTLDIKVNDDKPEIGICYTSGLEAELKREALVDGVGLSGAGGNSGIFHTDDYGRVDEDWLRGASGNSYSYYGNQDKDGNNCPNPGEEGDRSGKTKVCGEIDIHYGGDGKGSGDLGLFSYTVGQVFKDGDGTGNSFTSGGKELVVLYASPDFVEVGIKGPEYLPGATTSVVPYGDKTIFNFSFNEETGKFEFNLFGPIDHDPVESDSGKPETNEVICFDLGTVTDGDGDKADAIVKIKVNDDHPEIGITYHNNLEHDFGVHESEPTGLSGLSGGGGNATHDYGHVDEDFLKTGSQASGLHYYGNQDLDANQLSNANQHGDDIGKTEVCGDININYGGDGGASHTIGLDVYTIPDFPDPIPNATKQEIVDQILAYNATIPVFKNVDGSTVSQRGVELQILESDSGHLQVGTPPYFTINDNILTLVAGTVVFDITVDSNGHFDFKLWSEIDHDPQSGPDGVETNELLTFKAGSATDNDGDAADAVIKIQVNDDSPEVGVEYVNNDGYFSTTVGIVDEDHVFSGVGNQDADSTPGDTDGKGAVFFDLTAGGIGADGPGDPTAIGFTAQENDTLTVKDDNGDSHTLETADGHTVLVHVDTSSSGFAVLYGYFNSDDSVGFVDGSSTKVFSLSFNQSTMDGQFNLERSLAHPLGNEDNLLLSFGIKTGLSDGDGDPAIAWINIKVNDDGPQAGDDEDPSSNYVGNVMDNDKKGADDAKVTGASSTTGGDQSADINGDTTVVGALGLLIIHANGQWEYSPTPGTAGGTDEFTYTLTDGDGDTDSATLTITVPSDISTLAFVETGPTHTPADHYDREVTVNALGTNAIIFDNKSTHFEDPTGGHVISGGGGNDWIHVTGNTAAPVVFGIGGLNGGGGDDIIQGGGGKDQIHGNAGDDTIYGGNNDDDLYGDSGHDAMDGGAGNDKIHVDADDLDGTNTLDGFHSIDGGDGYDTVDISSMKSFDSNQAMHLENVEALAMDGKAGSGGTTMTLTYDAAYGITQVGGLHALSITGDATGKGADTVHLQGSSGFTWNEIGNSHVYEAGIGASKVTVTVEQGVNVDLS